MYVAFVLLLIAIVAGILPAALPHRHVGLWFLRDGANLRNIHYATHKYVASLPAPAVPDSWEILIEDEWLPVEVLRSAKRAELGEVTVGELEGADPAAWERLGDFVYTRELALIVDEHPECVAGFALFTRVKEDRVEATMLLGINEVVVVPLEQDGSPTREYVYLVAADREARAELGLSEPPDYAALIREYVEAQK